MNSQEVKNGKLHLMHHIQSLAEGSKSDTKKWKHSIILDAGEGRKADAQQLSTIS